MRSKNMQNKYVVNHWLVPNVAIFAFACMSFAGCHMSAPMHTWKASQVSKPGQVRIAVAPIGGSSESAERLQNAMKLAQPQPNPLVAALHPSELAQVGGIQLVSFDRRATRRHGLHSPRPYSERSIELPST
jgi:hypothetical protein